VPGGRGRRERAERWKTVFDPRVPGMPAAQPQAVGVAAAGREHVPGREADAFAERRVEQFPAPERPRQLQPQDEPAGRLIARSDGTREPGGSVPSPTSPAMKPASSS
jgi:hypothetical protein